MGPFARGRGAESILSRFVSFGKVPIFPVKVPVADIALRAMPDTRKESRR